MCEINGEMPIIYIKDKISLIRSVPVASFINHQEARERMYEKQLFRYLTYL